MQVMSLKGQVERKQIISVIVRLGCLEVRIVHSVPEFIFLINIRNVILR